MAVAEEAEVADAVKSVGQHMDQKAANELIGILRRVDYGIRRGKWSRAKDDCYGVHC